MRQISVAVAERVTNQLQVLKCCQCRMLVYCILIFTACNFMFVCLNKLLNKADTDIKVFTVACRTWICSDWLHFHQAKPLSYKVAGIVRYLCSNELSVYCVRQEDAGDCSTPTAGGSSNTSRDSSPSRPTQKNKRRCFNCRTRLELAFMEIGRCKCGMNNGSHLWFF